MTPGTVFLLSTLAILAEVIVGSPAVAVSVGFRFAVSGLVCLGGALLLARAGPRRRPLPALVVLSAAVLSLLGAAEMLPRTRVPADEAVLRSRTEQDAETTRTAFAALFARERGRVLQLAPRAEAAGSSAEMFALLAEADAGSSARTPRSGTLTIYDASGSPFAWSGEGSILTADDLTTAGPGSVSQFVRREILGTRLFTVLRLGTSDPRYLAAEVLFDAPFQPGAWRRLLGLPAGFVSRFEAEFFDRTRTDAALAEFLQVEGGTYWTRGRGGELRLILPLRTAGATLVGILAVSPARDEPSGAQAWGSWELVRSIVLALVLLLALGLALIEARRSGAALVTLAGLAALLIGARVVVGGLMGISPYCGLFDYRYFSMPTIGNLAATPGEALGTGVLLLGLAALLGAGLTGRASWARAVLLLAALTLGGTVLVETPAFVRNAAVNLARSPFLSHASVRLALLGAHAAAATAVAVLIYAALGTRKKWPTYRGLAICWISASILSYLAIASVALGVPAALIETSLAPVVVGAPDAMRGRLPDLLEDAASDPRWALAGSADPEELQRLTFETWRSSELGRNGIRSAIALLGPDGRPRSSFAYGLPESVFRDLASSAPSGESQDGSVSPGRVTEQRFTVLSLQIPLMRGEIAVGPAAGEPLRLAVLISREWDNIPFLTLSDPLLRTLGAGRPEPVFEEYFWGAPLFIAYAPTGEVLFPTAERAAPIPRQLLPLHQTLWTTVEHAGRTHRAHLFPTPDGPRAIGYIPPNRIFLAAGLVRALVAGLPLLIATLALLWIVRAPALRESLSPRQWSRTFAGSYFRRLLAVVLVFSLAPLLVLAGIFRTTIEARGREELERHGIETAGTIRRLLEDYVESGAGLQGGPSPIDSRTLFWLGRTVHEDIDIFVNAALAATSRGNLEASGLRGFRLAPEAARALMLDRRAQLLVRPEGRGRAETMVYAPVRLAAGSPYGVLAVPLLFEAKGLGRDGEEMADAILTATFGLGLLLLGVGTLFARRLSVPIRDLAGASQRIAEGDLRVRVSPRGRDEIRQLIDAFNGMAVALGDQREDLRRRKDYIEAILLNVTTGVISTDAHGVVRTANPAASFILGLSARMEGTNLSDELARRPHLAPIRALWFAEPAPAGSPVPKEVSIERDGEEVRLRSVVLPLRESADAPPGRIHLVEDVTEVMKSNRLAAWAEMARSIAHEIKNPLTPIQLSAEHLLRVARDGAEPFDRVLRECVDTILEQVGALREISTDFSAYARLPDLRRTPTDLAQLVSETAAPYRSAPPPGVRIEIDPGGGPGPTVEVDGRVLRRAIVNLIENALQAMDGGGILTISVRTQDGASGHTAEIVVADTGEGIAPEILGRIFEPYFSTRDSGVGLGLAIARRAVEEHGGSLTVESQRGRGTRMIVQIPTVPGPSQSPPA